MSEAQAHEGTDAVAKLGFQEGDYVQEFGYDDDVDFDFRDDLEGLIDSDLLTEDDHDVVDGVILWWRDGDGDLVDMLVDAQATLDGGGALWLLTPKSGRDGYVSPGEIQSAAPTAGLHATSTAGVSQDWAATRLAARRANTEK